MDRSHWMFLVHKVFAEATHLVDIKIIVPGRIMLKWYPDSNGWHCPQSTVAFGSTPGIVTHADLFCWI